MTVTNYKKELFDLDPSLVYLNHAAVAPWPLATAKAVSQFAAENSRLGTLHYMAWLKTDQQLRERLASLINAPSSRDISLVKSTSEGLSIIAYGIPWQAGDNIVVPLQEFPSNRIVWESLTERYGVEIRLVDLHGGEHPESALQARCDENTRLLSVSSVQYANGLRLNLAPLGEFCRRHGVLFCIDAIQSIGALRFDLQQIGAHFVVADGHKWMLGPEGLGVLYVEESLRPKLTLRQFGWHMVKHRGDYERDTWEPADNGTRFECGSPNMLGIMALNASLGMLESVGMEAVESAVLANSAWLLDALEAIPKIDILTPTARDRRSGIVTFRPQGANMTQLHAALTERGVICAQRGGGIRFSPHFYIPKTDLERAVTELEQLLK